MSAADHEEASASRNADEPPAPAHGGVGATSVDPLWPPAFGAWIKVGVLYQKTSQYLATRLRPLGLTVAQFDALANLYVGDDIAQNELALRLLVTKGNMTGLVRRLVERGWVLRQTDPTDGRIQRLRLTDEGRRLAVEALLVQRALVEEMMGDLTRTERESLRNLLARCIERVEAKTKEP